MFLNDGMGYFTDVTDGNVPYLGDHSYTYLKAADITGDGKLDLMAGGWSNCHGQYPRFLIAVNGGDPFEVDEIYLFDHTSKWMPSPSTYTYAAALADFNGDGRVDLYLGRGSGNNQNRFFLNTDEEQFKDVTTSHLPSIADYTQTATAGDFDNDDDLDIYVTNWGQDRLHLQEIDHKFADVTTSNLPQQSYQSHDSVSADYDDDGMLDVFSANWDQQNRIYFNLGFGKFQERTENLPWDIDYARGVVAGDFDDDGDIDLFIGNTGLDRIFWNTTVP